jgi:hypothetical protein
MFEPFSPILAATTKDIYQDLIRNIKMMKNLIPCKS